MPYTWRLLLPLLLALSLPCTLSPSSANPEPDTPWGQLLPQHPPANPGRSAGALLRRLDQGQGGDYRLHLHRLRQVQNLLGDRVGKDIFIYSISIDPYNDTPATLKRYAEKFAIAPGWTLLTGEAADIEQLRRSLGLYIDGLENGRSKDHNLSLIIGNQATGRWMKASPFESPYILADRLANSLHNWKQAVATASSEAPAIRPPSTGEQLFRTRCSSCHTLGDATPGATHGIGPDLLGVTRQRDPAWLVRWLKEPDKMLAEKDPLAMLLYEQYNQLAMPNMRLGQTEVEALLDYLEEETQRLQTPTVQR